MRLHRVTRGLPIACRLESSCEATRMAAVIDGRSVRGTTIPVSLSRTADRIPPESPATDGTPEAPASTKEMPNPSALISRSTRDSPT